MKMESRGRDTFSSVLRPHYSALILHATPVHPSALILHPLCSSPTFGVVDTDNNTMCLGLRGVICWCAPRAGDCAG